MLEVKPPILYTAWNSCQRSNPRPYTLRETDARGKTHDFIQRVTFITRPVSGHKSARAPKGAGARQHTERLIDHKLYRVFERISSILFNLVLYLDTKPLSRRIFCDVSVAKCRWSATQKCDNGFHTLTNIWSLDAYLNYFTPVISGVINVGLNIDQKVSQWHRDDYRMRCRKKIDKIRGARIKWMR